jgi:hypothetical protein
MPLVYLPPAAVLLHHCLNNVVIIHAFTACSEINGFNSFLIFISFSFFLSFFISFHPPAPGAHSSIPLSRQIPSPTPPPPPRHLSPAPPPPPIFPDPNCVSLSACTYVTPGLTRNSHRRVDISISFMALALLYLYAKLFGSHSTLSEYWTS